MFRLRSKESIEATLRHIEQRVLDEVHLSSSVRRTGAVSVVVLILAAVTEVIGHGAGLPLVAAVLAAGSAFCSTAALRLRRFGWASAAAYLSGLTAVASAAAFWWCQTSGADASLLVSTAAGGLAAATLTIVWISVVITPAARSQPDMRYSSQPGQEPRSGGGTHTWPPPCAGPHPPDQK
ncbi:hypothetical protein [Mycobacterium sp. ACS4331]|uniref:hypothetical protein n=1 Tax=Mycobacterium sp. ACS4331 TaxID=1834121 RepID=UPI0007FD5C6C|nr:hypothetical protein [Mycobacterium sp. ACS4331]OBF29789.1 hypothetical protein A5727_23220 [Mycobacterium sp. ACS4331]